jgi:threonine dehydratase
MPPLGPEQVLRAARYLDGIVVRTPVLRCPSLDRLAGCRVWLKAESLQLSGSYKIRGALFSVHRALAAGARGVLAQSTGNHGIAVATAAARHGLTATIVLPSNAPEAKISKVRAAGGEVVLVGASLDDRCHLVNELHERTGHVVLDAFDHPDVIAGQGTATVELLDQVHQLGGSLGAVVIPVGGGGGVAGACLAAQSSGVAVYAVEPAGCDSMATSLAVGARTAVPPRATIADGLTPTLVGELPFRVARDHHVTGLTVSEDEITTAVRLALTQARLVVEPSAAAALAGALRLARRGGYTDIGAMLTGSNVATDLLCRLLSQPSTAGSEIQDDR